MESRVELLLDDFDGVREMHAEYVDTIDLDDFEARRVWELIESRFKELAQRVKRVRRSDDPSEDELEELEMLMEELSDQYTELAALV